MNNTHNTCGACQQNYQCAGECSNTNSKQLKLITSIFLNLTQACNLKCKYCFIHQSPQHMTYETARDTVHFLANNAKIQNDIPSINYFGGEPTLMWDSIIVPLTEYIRKVYGEKFTLSMTSNGILLDEEKLEFMKKNNIGLLFSIDGDKKTQVLNRPLQSGGSSFDILKDKIPLILKYYPNATFRATIDHDNASDVVHNYEFAMSQGYNNVFMIPNVFAKWSKEEIDALQNGLKGITKILLNDLRQGKRIGFSPITDMFDRVKRINFAEKNNNFRDHAKGHIGYGRCGIGANKFASVGPGGVLYSCQELVGNGEFGAEFIIGNIYTGVENEKRWDIINRFDPRNVISSSGKTCKECKFNKICDGFCLINNYFATGDMNIVPEIACTWYQMLLEEAIYIINTMGQEKNEFFKRNYMQPKK